MNNKPIAIVLGGTNPHITLLNKLRERGYYTVLIDYYENPPAKSYADEHIRESTLDQEKVLEIAKEKKADLVISTSIDQANVTACYVGEKLDLPIPYSYETALTVTNKILMKEIMKKNGIPTSNFIKVSNIAALKISDMPFPLVIKPSDTTGSKGVRKACNKKELEVYLKEAIKLSRNNLAIVEEFVKGVEIQVDFFVENGKIHLIMTREKCKIGNEKEIVLQSLGSIVPALLSETVKKKIYKIAEQIVRSFKLNNTSFFIQAIVNGDNISVIEFACRIGGGLSYSMINIITKFDILNATIDSFLKIPVDVNYEMSSSYYATYLIYAEPGVFDRIEGYKRLLDKKVIEQFYILKTKGMPIGDSMASGDRVGAFLVKADTKDELNIKIKDAINKLQVYDINGSPIMRKMWSKN